MATEIVGGETKVCKKCGVAKAVNAYHIDRSTPDGRKYRCRSCANAVRKQWITRNPERVAAGKRASYQKHIEKYKAYNQSDSRRRAIFASKLRSYGITQDDFERMIREQDGRCAICNDPPELAKGHKHKHRLCIDHDHKTGLVRGLLCVPCNAALGHLRDNPTLFLRAVDYLHTHARETTNGTGP